MQWNENKNAGFTEGTPWISVANNKINAKSNVEDKDSVYNYYKNLIKLRKDYNVISHGTIKPVLKDDDKILAYVRKYNDEKLLVVCNFFGEETSISIDKEYTSGKVIISNYDDVLIKDKMKLRPYECFAILI